MLDFDTSNMNTKVVYEELHVFTISYLEPNEVTVLWS